MHADSPTPIETITRHLEEHGIDYEVVEHDAAFTAAAEARAAGEEPANAVKSVLLRDLEGYELVVLQASDRLDLRKVRDQLGESRSELRLATEGEMDADFPQFELGALPPLGDLLPAPEIVDRRVLDHDRVLCNGGTTRTRCCSIRARSSGRRTPRSPTFARRTSRQPTTPDGAPGQPPAARERVTERSRLAGTRDIACSASAVIVRLGLTLDWPESRHRRRSSGSRSRRRDSGHRRRRGRDRRRSRRRRDAPSSGC
jgi:Ala-tRNA(Pro) deacylase